MTIAMLNFGRPIQEAHLRGCEFKAGFRRPAHLSDYIPDLQEARHWLGVLQKGVVIPLVTDDNSFRAKIGGRHTS